MASRWTAALIEAGAYFSFLQKMLAVATRVQCWGLAAIVLQVRSRQHPLDQKIYMVHNVAMQVQAPLHSVTQTIHRLTELRFFIRSIQCSLVQCGVAPAVHSPRHSVHLPTQSCTCSHNLVTCVVGHPAWALMPRSLPRSLAQPTSLH